jgi:hypothetical protein
MKSIMIQLLARLQRIEAQAFRKVGLAFLTIPVSVRIRVEILAN